jgi:IclR family transcriptional regulator, pca regulon regulatory protein
VRYALRVSSNRIVAANIPPGATFPAHATAMGKVLLADLSPSVVCQLAERHPFVCFTDSTVTSVSKLEPELRQVAHQGYAVSDAEWEPGLRSIAAPLRNRDGRVAAAVCVLSVQPATTLEVMERDYLPSLLDTAQAISRELGYAEGSSRVSSLESRVRTSRDSRLATRDPVLE